MTNAVTDNPDEYGRPEPPPNAGEVDSMLGFLDFHRATLVWKCSGLDSDGLSATTAASTMTLGGVMKHMAYVEDHWFSVWLHGNDKAALWRQVDWQADRDWDWNSASDDTPDELLDLWQNTVDRSRELTTEALNAGGLDTVAKRAWSDGRSPSLRWILLHMIEEYARHNGHADLLRESVDGSVGE